jgi:hypothetical protein
MIRRSKHSLSCTTARTFDPGEFIPIGLSEILPGDSIQHKTDAVIRTLPLNAPLMHEVEILITHSYVPYRLIWEDWEDFITGGDDGLDASILPTIDFSGSPVAKGDLAHYLGLPIGFNTTASALPFRAYAKFWNDHIRDEELQTELTIDITSGPDTTTSTTLKNVNWALDRFTASNANEQLGSSITIPLGTDAPVTGIGKFNQTFPTTSQAVYETDGSGTTTYDDSNIFGTASNQSMYVEEDPNNPGYPNIRVDLTGATGATINELREAIALQKFAEMRQIYGSTYEKLIEHDFNVTPRDQRLQNSEIISRGRGVLQFTEVLQTGVDSSDAGVGEMKGHAIAAARSNKYRKFFPEYGYLMSFVTIRPKPVYSQGVPRHFLKATKEDYYNPHLENMGMQEITNREIKYDHSTPGGTFGYEPRYNEYRHSYNDYRGEFADTLDYWHMGRELSGDPALNSTFITCSPTNRVFQQSATDNILGMFRHSIQARRLVKKSVKPVGLI